MSNEVSATAARNTRPTATRDVVRDVVRDVLLSSDILGVPIKVKLMVNKNLIEHFYFALFMMKTLFHIYSP